MVDDLFDVVGDDASGDDTDAVVLRVHVQPGAGRSAVVGRHGDALKLRVAAPPEGGRANDAVKALLAETFGVKSGDVELTSGASSRMKRFRLDHVDVDDFRSRLDLAVAGDARPGAGGTRNR